MTGRGFYHSINARQWETVLEANLVQFSEVHTHSPPAVKLFYHHYIRKTFRILDLPNVVGLQQLGYFFPWPFKLIDGEVSFFLL